MLSTTIVILSLLIIWNILWSPSQALCYGKRNSSHFCQPNFINILQNATATASSTCGTRGYTEEICDVTHPEKCFTCDSRREGKSANVSLLFDHHTKGQETCWVSGRISKIADMVNVTIKLDKLYEAYYITIEFCGQLPDSVVLSKSKDNGVTWTPWHFFSSTCQKTFRMKRTTAVKMERKPKFQTLTPVCFSLPKNNRSLMSENNVIAFNPMIGRNMIGQDTLATKDWASLTNLKVSMIVDNSGRVNGQRLFHLGISDVTIGGRVQCYGHAADLRSVNGIMMCACTHNTDGSQCNTCLRTHNDSPWQPRSKSESSIRECQKCECNNHAEECTFDQAVFDKSNRIHGSKCINCSHHTIGPQCGTCSPGYHRDRTFLINDTRACQQCKCHIIGANSPGHCDPISGKCHCKDGVEGTTCNRCKKGYQQTSSSIRPCVPYILKKMMATEIRCELCNKQRPRIKFKKFCRQDIIIKITIQSKQILGNWSRLVVRVDTIWRLPPLHGTHINKPDSDYSMYPIWVETSHIRCSCPEFELGHTYLLLTKIREKPYLNQSELIVDRKSTVLTWKDIWHRRLNKFTDRDKHGKCHKFKYRYRYSNQLSKKSHLRYMSDG